MIYIFGDSFGENPHSSDKKSLWTWPVLLRRRVDERVKNLCEGATGPLSAFQDFWRHFNDIKKDHESKIVFLLSDPFRIPFDFLEDNHQPEAGCWMQEPSSANLDFIGCGYFKEYKKEMFAFRHVMYGELKNLNTKNISLLKCLSMILKKKIIVFVCFSFDKNFPEIKGLNDKYFKIYDRPLHGFSPDSLNLTPDEVAHSEIDFDNVICHLNKEDHEIVYNIIMNHFYGGDRSEKFHFVNEQLKQNSKNKFVYE